MIQTLCLIVRFVVEIPERIGDFTTPIQQVASGSAAWQEPCGRLRKSGNGFCRCFVHTNVRKSDIEYGFLDVHI